MSRRLLRLSRPGLALVALLGLVCVAAAARAAPPAQTLRVFAAASLAEAFGEIAKAFEQDHPGVAVKLNLAGSQQLASQVELGAAADVFASADMRWMTHLTERRLVDGAPALFAHNRVVVVIPRTNPARIRGLADLSRRGTKLVIGAEAVPVGAYSREVLRHLSRSPELGPDFAKRTLVNVVSEEENVKSVLGKVQIGEADAGMVYRSDVTPTIARFVRVLEIPDSANVRAEYPIAVLSAAAEPEMAKAFVDRVLSPRGQAVLERRGLIPVRPTSP